MHVRRSVHSLSTLKGHLVPSSPSPNPKRVDGSEVQSCAVTQGMALDSCPVHLEFSSAIKVPTQIQTLTCIDSRVCMLSVQFNSNKNE